MLKTLNISDSPWACEGYNLGTCGHRADTFEEACALAQKHGFAATNLHVEFLREHGPKAVKAMLARYGLQPGAARFPVKLTDECTDAEFDASLRSFEEEAPLLAAAGYTVLAYHLLPWSQPATADAAELRFHPHFRAATTRLTRVAPVLAAHGLRVGLECIGAFGLRRCRKHDFVHTIEGVRCLIAAASAEASVGIKFDVFHWHVCGGLLGEIAKLDPSEIVYVELNDGVHPNGRWDELEVPELHRELPGESGHIIDSPGALAVLEHIGYVGPVVVEPFNRALMALPIDAAVQKVSAALDATMAAAAKTTLPPGLIGTHPYRDEPPPVEPSSSPGAAARCAAEAAAQAAHASLSSAPPLRWGILATGKASSDFAQALRLVAGASVVAVGARNAADAAAFAKRLGVANQAAHGNGTQPQSPALVTGTYEDVARSEAVDVVYVGTLHPWHRQHAELCLAHAKHVLVEKPIAMSHADAEAIYAAGRAANRLVLEGMWTRFFPAVERARALLAGGAIGDVVSVRGDFGVAGAQDIGPYPADTIFQRSLGGGAVTLLGPYLVQAAMLGLAPPPRGGTGAGGGGAGGGEANGGGSAAAAGDGGHGGASGGGAAGGCLVAAAGVVDAAVADGGGGAELAASASLRFPPPPPRPRPPAAANGHKAGSDGGSAAGAAAVPRLPPCGGLASLSVSLLAESAEEVTFVGTHGTLALLPPAHCPTTLVLKPKGTGRGGCGGGAQSTEEVYVDSLPAEPAAVSAAGGFIMPNSIGFAYEAAAVAACVAAAANGGRGGGASGDSGNGGGHGGLALRQWPAEESLRAMAIVEEWRRQVLSAAPAGAE